jgi:ABC-type phosphate/phosphonate transport system, ATPase component
MLKLIIGVKGTGKTKTLIEMVNSAIDSTKGAVVCIEKGDKLKFDIKYQCRLIDTDEYLVKDAQSLYGFVAGILASNHDVTDLFIDSALKICRNDYSAHEKLLLELDEISEKLGINCVVTSSLPQEDATDVLKKYL